MNESSFLGKFKTYLSFVKFAHTVFAMPFAFTGLFFAFQEKAFFSWKLVGLVVLAMVFARNAAMGFNRYIDRDIDALNERTKNRELPAGKMTPKQALAFVILNSVAFVVTTYFINNLAFYLSPVALGVILGYSLTKRFTWLCHLILGLGLGLAPVGAYVAATASFSVPVILLGIAVMTWVAGFDILYALQDAEFDKKQNLYSIPAMLGKEKAISVSRFLHLLSAVSVSASLYLQKLSFLGFLGGGIFIASLIYQHFLVAKYGLKKINLAFFTTNGFASVLFAVFVIADILINFF